VAPQVPVHFLTLSHKWHDFPKKSYWTKNMCFDFLYNFYFICVLIFSTTFISNISHSKKYLAWYCHKCENVFMWITRYSCRILPKLVFSRHIFDKSLNIKFHQNPSVALFHADGRAYGHDETVAFRNFANAPKKNLLFRAWSFLYGEPMDNVQIFSHD
jgi:hypothetical protein